MPCSRNLGHRCHECSYCVAKRFLSECVHFRSRGAALCHHTTPVRAAFPMDRGDLRSERSLYARPWLLDDPYAHHHIRNLRAQARLGLYGSHQVVQLCPSAVYLPHFMGVNRSRSDDRLLHSPEKSVLPQGDADLNCYFRIIKVKLRPEFTPMARAEK